MISSKALIDECACTRLRTAARQVTRVYDDALRPTGVNASQLAMLAAIDVSEAASIADLARRLAMDRTTLSRNLRPLEIADLVRIGDEGWKRSRTVRLTATGKKSLGAGKKLWNAVQSEFLARFGAAEWQRVDHDLRAIDSLYSS